MSDTSGTTSDIPDERNPNGYYPTPRECFYCDATFQGRNEFWEHVADERREWEESESNRPSDEDRAGGRNTLTRHASGDLAR